MDELDQDGIAILPPETQITDEQNEIENDIDYDAAAEVIASIVGRLLRQRARAR